ncbi:hypothetical protein L0Y69_01025 [bacterium]|nr:hypothetical protein [bacterium]
MALLPFFAVNGWPSVPPAGAVSSTKAYLVAAETVDVAWQEQIDKARKTQADKIDAYFRERKMPLAGFGEEMVVAAEEHDLDWRLLPAIAVRESSGGKHMCGHNPFGWASCKVRFGSVEKAIDTVALHLGGNHPNTDQYYSGGTREKLHSYNGTVIPTYVDEVENIMDRIEAQEVE